MRASITRPREPLARVVRMTEATLTVDLQDGRTISVPLEWAQKYQDELIQDWELARRHEELRRIPPLE